MRMSKDLFDLTPDEIAMVDIIRQYKFTYADFKIEVRDGKVARVLPTFSVLIAPTGKKNKSMI